LLRKNSIEIEIPNVEAFEKMVELKVLETEMDFIQYDKNDKIENLEMNSR